MAGLSPPRPLATDDDLAAFDCGRDSLNHWLRRHALRNQRTGASRTSVICDENGTIVGYVALSAGQIERGRLPRPAQRNKPDPVPALLLGQLAVDRRHQGGGVARRLLHFALKTALQVAEQIGCPVVLTHPLDGAARGFWLHHGFIDLPGDPHRAMIVRLADLARSGFQSPAG